MSSTTTIPNIPNALDLKLPSIASGTMPVELAELGAPWAELLADRDRRVEQAKDVRRRFEQARKSVADAIRKDKDAALAAVEGDQPAPGLEHRSAALAEVERLHAEAEAATSLANRTARALRDAVDSDAGDKAMAALDKKIAKARDTATKRAEAVSAALADLGTLAGVRATLPATRKSRSVLAGGAKRGHAGLGGIHFASGQRQGVDGLLGGLARAINGDGER